MKIYTAGQIGETVIMIIKLVPQNAVLEQKINFIPSYAGKIWIYNLDKGLWDSIIINYPDIRLNVLRDIA